MYVIQGEFFFKKSGRFDPLFVLTRLNKWEVTSKQGQQNQVKIYLLRND